MVTTTEGHVLDPARIAQRLTGLPGLNPEWSRVVRAVDADGVERAWHLLDTHASGADGQTSGAHDDVPRGTVLAVHGNPTWSYLWRRVLAAPPAGWRVIAVDQLGMGYSEHPRGTLASPRSLTQRIEDLTGLTDALGGSFGPGGRVVVVGHDWGGMVAAGWALARPEQAAGLVLANTTVHHDFENGVPKALQFSAVAPVLKAVTVDTPTFVRAATAVSSPRPSREVRRAYASPYRTARERAFVGQFVADIPGTPGHPTRAGMRDLAERLADPAAGISGRVPTLLLRGPKDPVFSEAHLADLCARLPQADVHRYEGASHLVPEDAPAFADHLAQWVAARLDGARSGDPEGRDERPAQASFAVGTSSRPWAGMTAQAATDPDAVCVAEVATGRSITFGQIETEVEHLALGLREAGVKPGDRIGLLVEPGIDLTVAAYASWRAGATIVVADAGLGLGGMGRALRGAGVAHVFGIPRAMKGMPILRVPGQRILVGELAPALRSALRIRSDMDRLRARGAELAAAGESMPEVFSGGTDAAVLFTSGATGPSKGVVYTADQIRAQVGGFGSIYNLRPGDRLVAAFAPFALYGPALGVGGVVPDMKVTAPATLTAAGLADAVIAAGGTTVFASPAALRNVLRTAAEVTPEQKQALAGVRTVMSAGAPVPVALLRDLVTTLFPEAEMHTPYGMTECLPVSDVTLEELESVYETDDKSGVGDEGVCVGLPLEGVELAVAPFPERHDAPDGHLVHEPGVSGEVMIRAPHMRDRYDQLWATTHAASDFPPGWHRSGDVGHLDEQGRLWIEGRRVHVVHTAQGPVTPVGLEQRVESLPEVESAAVVGVGPLGVQQVVVVVTLEGEAGNRRAPGGALADTELTRAVRDACARPVAAVLVRESMPVDIRHQSKIDRTELAEWATTVLAGDRGAR